MARSDEPFCSGAPLLVTLRVLGFLPHRGPEVAILEAFMTLPRTYTGADGGSLRNPLTIRPLSHEAGGVGTQPRPSLASSAFSAARR